MTVASSVLLQKRHMSSNPARHRQHPHHRAPAPAPAPPPTSSTNAFLSEPARHQPHDPPSPATTATTATAAADNPPKQPSPEDYYRAFDRHFASRYLNHLDAQRKRAASVANGQLPLMKPRMQIYAPPAASHVTALFEVPGLKSSDISVNVTRDGRLTVSGERRPPDVFADAERRSTYFPVQELKYGRFERTLSIPPGVESRHITASLNEGILSLSWPRTPPTDARGGPNSPPVTSVQALIH